MPSKSKASIVHLRKQPATVDHHLCQEFFFFKKIGIFNAKVGGGGRQGKVMSKELLEKILLLHV